MSRRLTVDQWAAVRALREGEETVTRYDDDLSVYHGLMRFRAVTEAAG